MVNMRNSYKILIGKPEGKRKYRVPSKWEDNIKVDV
jgi:hypothetical protein